MHVCYIYLYVHIYLSSLPSSTSLYLLFSLLHLFSLWFLDLILCLALLLFPLFDALVLFCLLSTSPHGVGLVGFQVLFSFLSLSLDIRHHTYSSFFPQICFFSQDTHLFSIHYYQMRSRRQTTSISRLRMS